jgi:membrane-bound lytic murein transglycosylase D
MKHLLRILLVGLLGASVSGAAPRDFPQPPELNRDVAFWKRIYSEIDTNGGLLHDARDLSIVYEVVDLPSGASVRARERLTEGRRKHYRQILLDLAKGKRSHLSREEQRVLALFGDDVSNATLRSAANNVRFQLGQANKFRAGVIRSGAYKPEILEALREANLPLEIAHLPHVESSYTPTVYSRVGAAGLWQFTRSTGRRFMRVDHVVDERLDPYRASVAAARLLEQNYRVTGSWPLAITAYNHGASGMRRAAQQLGTKDIVKIVRDYKSRTFGFASRNFYVEFLAADAVASDAEFYFGPLPLDQPIQFDTVELPYFVKSDVLADALGVDIATLREANPALRPSVWQNAKYIPKGFHLRVPRAALAEPIRHAIAAVPDQHRHARQTLDADYVVRRGDNLSSIARRHGVRMSDLVAINGLKSKNRIRVGQKLRLPTSASTATRTASYTPEKSTAPIEAKPHAPARRPMDATLPEDGIYQVRHGDNLTRIADRFGLSVPELVALNDLKSQNRISIGQRLRVSTNATERTETAEKTIVVASASGHPDAVPALSEARSASPSPTPSSEELAFVGERDDDLAQVDGPVAPETSADSDESATDPSPGLLADPSDYTVASNGTIIVQTNETLGHYAEWLGLRASRIRQINGLHYGEPVVVHQRLRLDFSNVRPEDFERVRVEFHRALQEEFFAQWEIEGTVTHRVGPGDSLWVLSRRRFDVPIWLLRQYNPDVDLDALTAGTSLIIPTLRLREDDSSATDPDSNDTTAG